MFLSELVLKNVCVRETPRAVCLGVGISLKNYTVKYLLCNSTPAQSGSLSQDCQADFCVNVSTLQSRSDVALTLSTLRPVFPKNCAKIFIGKPVYTQNGRHLGVIADMEIVNGVATKLFTEKTAYPITAICAVSDAVILRKEQPFPLGQRIPAHLVFDFSEKNEPLVTKSVLRKAIAKSSLIKLTLSLPPFHCQTSDGNDYD